MSYPEIIFPFGKYRGLPLSEIPIDYLEWALETVRFHSEFIECAVEARVQASYQALDAIPCDDSVVERVYRRLAVRHHPDKGGKPEAFKAIQEFYESVQEEST